MKRPVLALAGALLVAAAPRASHAQPNPQGYRNTDDFASEALYATGQVGIGARARGFAGNYVGIADDATALYYNPAGLAQLVRGEASVGLHTLRDESKHAMFGVTSKADATYSNIDHLAFAYPFPTYRGSLVIAGGVFRARSNDLDTSRHDRRTGTTDYRDDFDRSQRGGLWQWTGGLAVDLVRDLSFGFNLSYWHGELRDDQLRSIDESGVLNYLYTDRLVTQSHADGFSFDLGLMGYAGDHARLGVVVRSPVWMRIDGDGTYTLSEAGNTDWEPVYIADDPRLPWSAAAGASFGYGWLLATAEARYTAWDEIQGVPRSGNDIPGADPDYAAQWGLGAGAELVVPLTPLRVRAGWSRNPEPYQLLLGNPSTMLHEHEEWTVGGGVLVADTFALDVAVVFADFTRTDGVYDAVWEQREQRRVHVTGAYRF